MAVSYGRRQFGRRINANQHGGATIIILMIVPYVLLFLFFRKNIVSFVKEFAAAKG